MGPSGELLSMTGTSVSESRTYNVMGQVTNITGSGMNINYNYPSAGLNNGQMASQQDLVSGETVSYAYDSLKRLASASSNQGWGQAFAYDGFGNLTAKTATAGSPPVGSYPADPTTNRLAGGGYDANGNWGGASFGYAYDVSNRMTFSSASSQQALYEYNPGNKRVMQLVQSYDGNNWVTSWQAFYFYGIDGKKLGNYTASVSGSTVTWSLQSTQVFFKGRLIQRGGSVTQQDLRGSVGRYFPYGEEQTTPNAPNDQVKFGTYTRDSVSGLDYAMNRYHFPGAGRFTSPDPYKASAGPTDPVSWNRYTYVSGDPVGFNDPTGLGQCLVSITTWVDFDGDKTVTYNWVDCDDAPASRLINYSAQAGNVPVPKVGGIGLNTNQVPTFKAAFNDALNKLSKITKCSRDFDNVGLDVLQNATFSYDIVPTNAGMASDTTFAATNPGTQAVIINALGHFFGLQQQNSDGTYTDWRASLGAAGSQLSQLAGGLSNSDFDALILLHELGHLVGVLGDDTPDKNGEGQAASDAFNLLLLQDCFGKKVK